MSASSTYTSAIISLGAAIVIRDEPTIFVVPVITVSPTFASSAVTMPVKGEVIRVLPKKSSALES